MDDFAINVFVYAGGYPTGYGKTALSTATVTMKFAESFAFTGRIGRSNEMEMPLGGAFFAERLNDSGIGLELYRVIVSLTVQVDWDVTSRPRLKEPGTT